MIIIGEEMCFFAICMQITLKLHIIAKSMPNENVEMSREKRIAVGSE